MELDAEQVITQLLEFLRGELVEDATHLAEDEVVTRLGGERILTSQC